jgi:hypothetical protein|nr:MAG TPA_asm: hypothetical protein [Caudoviricetes sp.]
MQSGFILSQQDIKRIIAEYYHVPEDKVVQSKYSFFVIQDEEQKKEK